MKVNKDKPLLQACPRASGMMHMSNMPFSEASFRTGIFDMYIVCCFAAPSLQQEINRAFGA